MSWFHSNLETIDMVVSICVRIDFAISFSELCVTCNTNSIGKGKTFRAGVSSELNWAWYLGKLLVYFVAGHCLNCYIIKPK